MNKVGRGKETLTFYLLNIYLMSPCYVQDTNATVHKTQFLLSWRLQWSSSYCQARSYIHFFRYMWSQLIFQQPWVVSS